MGSKDVLKELVEKVNSLGVLEKEAANWNKAFQFKVSDSDPFFVKMEGGKATLSDGEDSGATATISATDAILSDLFSGKLDPVKAFMQGQIRISGDVFSAQKLTSIINKARK